MHLSIDFYKLPIEVVTNILVKTGFETLTLCERVSKLFDTAIKKIQDYNQKKEAFFLNKLMPEIYDFPPELRQALGGARKICQFPVIKLTDDNYLGQDGGTISVDSHNMFRHSVCRGLDKYNRPFIACAYQEKQGLHTTASGVMNIFKWSSSDGTFKDEPKHPKTWVLYSKGPRGHIIVDEKGAVGCKISEIKNLFHSEHKIDSKTISLDAGGAVFFDEVIDSFWANKKLVVLFGVKCALAWTVTAYNLYTGQTSPLILIPIVVLGVSCLALKILNHFTIANDIGHASMRPPKFKRQEL